MANTPYAIFLACLLLIDGVILYSYFLYCEQKNYRNVKNEFIVVTLKQAGIIQAAAFVVSIAFLYFFTPDKTWFHNSRFLYFGGLLSCFGLVGLMPRESKFCRIVQNLLELAGIAALVWFTPETDFLSKTPLRPEAFKIIAAVVWFIIFRLTCSLDRLEGLVYEQSFYLGFCCAVLIIFFQRPVLSLLQTGALFCPLIFLMAPFYYIFNYRLPMGAPARNIMCLAVTGVAFFLATEGQWGIAALMLSYILFEGIVITCRFLKNLLFRRKNPLYFFETLQERGLPDQVVINFILRRNILMSILIVLTVYASVQIQAVVLAMLLYLKFYLNITSPSSSKSSLADLYRQAKTDARKSLDETKKDFSQLREMYKNKAVKEKDGDTQP